MKTTTIGDKMLNINGHHNVWRAIHRLDRVITRNQARYTALSGDREARERPYRILKAARDARTWLMMRINAPQLV